MILQKRFCETIHLNNRVALTQQRARLKNLIYARIYALLVYLGPFSIHSTHCHKRHFLDCRILLTQNFTQTIGMYLYQHTGI